METQDRAFDWKFSMWGRRAHFPENTIARAKRQRGRALLGRRSHNSLPSVRAFYFLLRQLGDLPSRRRRAPGTVQQEMIGPMPALTILVSLALL